MQTTIGSLKVTPLTDGDFTLPRAIFPQAEENEAPAEMPATLNSFLIEDGMRKILIDAGAGSSFAETLGNVPNSLRTHNIMPHDITDIFLTHAHLDHVGGLIDSAGNLLFSHTQIHIRDSELEFWFNDEIYNSVDEGTKFYFDIARKSLSPYKNAGMIKTFDKNADMGGGIFAVDLPGHTAGHTGFRVTEGNQQLLIWGDIIHIPSVQMMHPDWNNNFDLNNEIANKTRQDILNEAATDHIKITGMHLPNPHFSYVEKRGNGFAFSGLEKKA